MHPAEKLAANANKTLEALRLLAALALVQLVLTGCTSPGALQQTRRDPPARQATSLHGPIKEPHATDTIKREDKVLLSFRLLAYVHGRTPGERKLYSSLAQYQGEFGAAGLYLDGFLFEVVGPKRFAGRLLAVHWNCIGPPRWDGLQLFQFDESYRLLVPSEWFEAREFELCGDAFRSRAVENP